MGLHLSREKIMANKRLTCHINTVSTGKHHVDVNVESQPKGAIRLNFQLTGDLEQIRIPAPQPPAAVDRLWEHTCFEVFIAAAGKANYHEFNFSPSGQWAAYAFSDYRMPGKPVRHRLSILLRPMSIYIWTWLSIRMICIRTLPVSRFSLV